jgi:pimeloyl-ACP methyl ester carboxylesterase
VTDGLLLVHAFPVDARMWEQQRSALEGAVPVLAPHLPGFGGAEPSGDVMTMASAAERCLAELDRSEMERAVVCGLSLGGYAAFELWRRAKERIAGLVLANTRAGADTDEAAGNRRALAERLRSEGNGFLVESPPALLSSHAPDELWTRVRSWIRQQPADAIAAAALGIAERPDSTPDLGAIDVPTLVVTSSDDTLIAPEISSPMAEQIPGAELSVIEGAGHLSNVEAPGEFNDLLRTHLERCGVA